MPHAWSLGSLHTEIASLKSFVHYYFGETKVHLKPILCGLWEEATLESVIQEGDAEIADSYAAHVPDAWFLAFLHLAAESLKSFWFW